MPGTIEDFHKLYYDSPEQTWKNTFWLGVPLQKCPLDLWIYQEIIFEVRPDLIVEAGTAFGGSAYYLACLLDVLGQGRIITVDVNDYAETGQARPTHPRIRYLRGSSVSEETVEEVTREIAETDRVMVILDSDHSREHVLKELSIYSGLVSEGSYLVVEDTNVNGHPVDPTHGPGPMEAVEQFLRGNDDFVPDLGREKFYLTFNPMGYLRKLSLVEKQAHGIQSQHDSVLLAAHLLEKQKKLARLEAELAECRGTLNGMRVSRSWRYSAPLRKSYTFLKELVHKLTSAP